MLSTIIKYLYLVALIAPMSILAMPITIIAPSKTFTLDVEPSDSIGTLRQLISDETSIPYDRVVITQSVEGGTAVLDDNYVSLSDRNIKKNDTLTVSKSNAVPSFFASTVWQDLGELRNNTDTLGSNIAIDKNNNPFVISHDIYNRVLVYHFVDESWQLLGGEVLSNEGAFQTDIVVDGNNTIYAAYVTKRNETKVVVKAFDGNTWRQLGSSQLTGSSMKYVDLKVDANNVLHIAYNDPKAKVKKWDGSNWVDVGESISYSSIKNPELVFNSQNQLHITYTNVGRNKNTTHVKRFDNNSWRSLSLEGLPDIQTHFPKLAFDSHDVPYISFIEDLLSRSSGIVRVFKYKNESWESVGDTSQLSAIQFAYLLISSRNEPYIAFSEFNTNGKGQLYTYQSESWQLVGQITPEGKNYYGIRMDAKFDSNDTFYAVDNTSEVSRPFAVKKEYAFFGNYSKTIQEGSASEFLFRNVTVSDTDLDDVTLSIIISNPEFGTLSGTASGGSSLNYDENTGTLTLAGSLSDINASLESIKLTPASNGAGEFTLTFSVSDGIESSSNVIGNYTVTAINKAPSISTNKGLSIDEGAVKVISALDLSSTDADDSGTGLIFTLKSVPSNGSLFVDANDNGSLDSGEALAVNGTFTQQTLDDSNLYYKHNGSETTSDSFTFDLADGLEDGVEPVTNQNFAISVSLINDAPVMSKGPSWDYIGKAHFSENSLRIIRQASDSVGNKYVAYTNQVNSIEKIWVMKHDGAQWHHLGGAEVAQVAISSPLSFAVDNINNIPYVAYTEVSGKTVVKKFEDNSWQLLGGQPISEDALHPSIIFDNNNTLHIVYQDMSVDNFTIHLQKWDGNNWLTVAYETAEKTNFYSIKLAFDGNNTPYIAYSENGYESYFFIKKLIGNTWEHVGPAKVETRIQFFDLLFKGNIPYIAIANSSRELSVKKFNGTEWVLAGNSRPTTEKAYGPDIALNSDGKLYIAYINDAGYPTYKLVVKELNEDQWFNVADYDFSDKVYSAPALEVYNNTPVVAFNDGNNDSRATMMEYSSSVFNKFTLTVSEDSDASLLFDNYQITDEEGDDVTLTITLANNTSGLLAGAASGSAVVNYNNDNATLTVSGSLADVTTTLANLSFKPAANFSGSLGITFNLTDGSNSITPVNGTITVTGVNDAPSISSIAVTQATEDTLYSYQLTVSDADKDDTFTYRATQLPSWLSLNPSGLLAGTPTNDDVGDHTVTISVTDQANASDIQSFTISVENVNDKPVISSTPIRAATQDQQYSYTLVASDIDKGDTLTYTATKIPGWLGFTRSTGELYGTPNKHTIGTYAITLTVTDSTGASVSQSFSITVENVNDAPEISSVPITSATEDSFYSYTLTAKDADKGDTLTYAATKLPNWLTINPSTGVLSGTPSNDDVGEHAVILSVKDGANALDTQSFTISVVNVNDEPVISSTPITVATEDNRYIYTLNASDVDKDDTLKYGATNYPDWMVFNRSTGVLTGTPRNDDVGVHSVTLTVTDSANATVEQTFTITVENVNDVPDVQNDIASVDEDNSVAIDILANDSDVDSKLNPASVMIVTPPTQGQTSLNTANGVITYTPNENINGTDTFSYTVDDIEHGRSDVATVTITINPVNDAPLANSDSAMTEEDMAIEIDVAINDADIDEGDSLDLSSLVVVSAPENGQANVQNERIVYTPASNFNGSDTFTYRIADKAGAVSNIARVLVTIGEVNDAPVATNDLGVLDEDTSIELSILDNDIDVDSELLTENVTITQAPKHGELTVNKELSTIRFTPHSDFFGTDSFEYSVKDEQSLMSNIATVTLTVNSVNDAPVAQNDTAVLLEDTSHNINVLGNDSDVDGTLDKTSLEVVTQPEHGNVQVNNGVLSYTPDSNSYGADTFTYRVKDDLGLWSNHAEVFITVTAVNDAPLANNDVIQTNEDESVIIDVTQNDSDIDGHLDEDSVNIVTNPAFGHITNNVDGTVTYTPISNYVGFDSFTYSVLDNEGAQSNTASVTITVLAVNDAPVIESHPVTSATQDEAYSYVVTVKDIDSADSYKLSALELPSWLDFDPTTGELSGTPSNDDVGTHSINLVATDAGGLTDTQTFAITVADVNDEATGGISITGEAKEGETLAVESTIEDLDGVGEFTYQWMRNGEIITGATLAEYMLTEADIGATITVVVTYVDGHGNTETFTSDATSVVIIANVAPVTHDEQFSMDEDESITFSLNYFDENGDELTLNLVTPVSNGTLLMDANHLVYQPNADFNGTDSFSYTVSDGMLNSNIATVTIVVNAINDAPVSMPDNFTVNADLNEYVVLDVLANDIDVDGDELTLVKATVSAGTIRIVDNKLEYLAPVGLNADVVITYQIKDSNGEVVEVTLVVSVVSTAAEITITAPEDKTIASKGLFTKVNMGTAIAKDALGNPVRVTASSKGFFAPGTHTVIWSAGEGDDQVSATQLINVIPQVNFSKNQTATEGTAVSIKAILNGDAVNYPVVVPYTVSGDALEGADHDLVEGEFRFEKGQREASLIVNVSSDDIDERSETLVLQFSTPENAVVGPLGEHTLTIEEGNVAPSIEVFANQQGIVTRIINRQGGDVTLTTLVTDANLTDTHIYGWLTSDSAIVDTDSVEESFTFDPQLLELGTYQFEVGVFDGQQAGSSLLELTIVDSMPQLSSEDTDFDGIPDNEEGYGDADNDGIPDYLDADSLALNVVQEKLNESEFFLMETEPGLQLSLGHVAFVAHGTNTGVSVQEVLHYGNYGSGATADAGFDYASGVFDFNVSQIPVAGQSVGIVIAQFAPIPSNAVYRKLMHTGWTEFVVDSRNSIASAPGAEGFCPPPHDAQYTQGLTEGHWCVQLTIEDGGPNDADGKVNRIIEDPSGIASTMSTNTQPVAEDDMVRVKRNISTYLDVLSNDTDANDDSLILTSAAVDIGEVSIVNNLLYFVPQAEHLGIATISYSISDSQGGADFATVIVDVVANEAPMIDAIIDVSTDDQSPVTIDILANVTDEDNNDFTIISATAENGSVVINDDGTITYTPNAGFEGTDTVTFVISDGDGGTTQGQFNVVVKAYKQVSVEHKTSGGGTLPMSLILLLFALTMIRRSYYRTYR
ncbi:Ig-like domain-containing protein [Pseudoalteromonas sp. bablab_jr010]|uniref:Ig-like domain-containing protein n=1 Tax=Pseudoalteromonas sp. bablab_jr010 TaxID=2755063 RepID=UPI0018F5A7C8|nr:Ig-like domain-containing protein [Pseudoalteromonas sp. bablab_jr010]